MKYRVTNIFADFVRNEKNAGLLLIFCTIVSLVVANTAVGTGYIHFWHLKPELPGFDLSIEQWINDGLMTIFFLMAGLEIERELYAGELHPVRRAVLPIVSAIGGMLFPALIYTAFNYNTSAANGFGIPMGTDIAFALGILSLAGNRVSLSVKILLTALAIIDDLGSVIVIALFYGSGIHLDYLLGSLGIFGILIVLNRLKIYTLWPYLLLGLPMWYCMMRSGVHPSVSGVLLAFACPFGDGSERSPSIKLQHWLHVPVALIILPLFTLANTAIPVKSEFVSGLGGMHALGIGFGLLIGKPAGILLTVFLLSRLKLVSLPEQIGWYELLAMGCIAGVGFTMSIFITQLAFSDELLIQSSRLVILITSFCAGTIGLLLFRMKKAKEPR